MHELFLYPISDNILLSNLIKHVLWLLKQQCTTKEFQQETIFLGVSLLDIIPKQRILQK